jgi:endonuclease/exonuclease/phosphatase (EEP) superfamily protein YafD
MAAHAVHYAATGEAARSSIADLTPASPSPTIPPMIRCRNVAPAIFALALTACVVVPERQHALVLEAGGTVAQRAMDCGDSGEPRSRLTGALDPSRIRLVSWNLHKQADPGWQADLGRLIDESDVLLLQEAEVSPELRAVVEKGSFSWLLSSAFEYLGLEYGVLTATRVPPASACTLRANEPLLGIPKAALITRYRLAGRDATLAVANLHAINFALGTDAYRAQLEAVADALSGHRGPIIVGGDFNTWNDARDAVVHSLASRLALTPVAFDVDGRKRFMGRVFDWIYAKDVDILGATSRAVSSSDHYPLAVTFRVP